MSKKGQRFCREIDIIKFKNTKKPVKLYTVDFNK